MRYHYIPSINRMSKIINIDHVKYWQRWKNWNTYMAGKNPNGKPTLKKNKYTYTIRSSHSTTRYYMQRMKTYVQYRDLYI